jgi:hypothetical protein
VTTGMWQIILTAFQAFVAGIAVFLERISVAPNAPAWFLDVVRDVMRKYGINLKAVPVQRSSLFEGPVKRL